MCVCELFGYIHLLISHPTILQCKDELSSFKFLHMLMQLYSYRDVYAMELSNLQVCQIIHFLNYILRTDAPVVLASLSTVLCCAVLYTHTHTQLSVDGMVNGGWVDNVWQLTL